MMMAKKETREGRTRRNRGKVKTTKNVEIGVKVNRKRRRKLRASQRKILRKRIR